MSKTPWCDELDEVATCMTADETVREWKRLAYTLETNNAALRADKERLDFLAALDCDDPLWMGLADHVDPRAAIDEAKEANP